MSSAACLRGRRTSRRLPDPAERPGDDVRVLAHVSGLEEHLYLFVNQTSRVIPETGDGGFAIGPHCIRWDVDPARGVGRVARARYGALCSTSATIRFGCSPVRRTPISRTGRPSSSSRGWHRCSRIPQARRGRTGGSTTPAVRRRKVGMVGRVPSPGSSWSSWQTVA